MKIQNLHIIVIAMMVGVLVPSCRKAQYTYDDPGREIVFAPRAEGEGETKATAVDLTSLNSSGFRVSATTGSAGSESSAWNSVLFTKSGDVFKGNKWWPNTNPSYHFYASNIALTFAAAGTTVSATTATDVVCAYKPSPVYLNANSITFDHIFARIGNVTTSATDGYTITGITVNITPNTGGTYNLRTGNGATDATGWSSLTAGSATNIANATPGTKSNDLYLVPGTYTLTLGWTATKGDYTKTYSGVTKSVTIVRGKVNSISCTFKGEASQIVIGVSLNAWGSQAHTPTFQ